MHLQRIKNSCKIPKTTIQEQIFYIDYIIKKEKKIIKKEIKPFCKKYIFTKLLRKLTQEYVFSFNNRLIKQVDGCPMGGPISVVFSEIYV